MKQIVVIGGGIVGLAVAYKVIEGHPRTRVVVIEKERALASHQSGNNSGVLHAGLYYQPGSFKAKLAVDGIRQMKALCQEHSLPHETCGKLVVATNDLEVQQLGILHERGVANGLAGVRRLSRDEMREREPHVGGIEGLLVPEEGIVDYAAVCGTMAHVIERGGGTVLFNHPVTKMSSRGGRWCLEAGGGDIEADFVINCAGLQSDRVSEFAGERRVSRIIPFRGEYFKLRPQRQHLVRHLIYPVPDPCFPFLGVHFTRLIHGGIEAGPNAVLAFHREGYRKLDFNMRDAWDTLSFPGLWRFVGRHGRMCAQEMRQSFSKRSFCHALQKLVPELQECDLEPGGAGVRAQAMTPSGELVQDFLLVRKPTILHVLNAPSPAATASLAIADEIVATCMDALGTSKPIRLGHPGSGLQFPSHS